MWMKEYIAIECLKCSKLWSDFKEWRDEDDDSAEPTTKAYLSKAYCKECMQEIEKEDWQIKEQASEGGSKEQ